MLTVIITVLATTAVFIAALYLLLALISEALAEGLFPEHYANKRNKRNKK